MTLSAHLISVHPQDLKFQFYMNPLYTYGPLFHVLVELEKQSYCDLKVTNNTEHHVAFKVKTTSPKKYFVRPNTGVVHPLDSCVIRVTLQAQRNYPRNMQCKDKFLLQSTVVPPNTKTGELPKDTFNKEAGNTLEEFKLRVYYITPLSAYGDFKDDLDHNFDANLETYKKRSYNGAIGFSIKFIIVGLVGITVGYVLNILLSST
ncbi:hypothetical protein CASFOL_037045 [Castilleja foliolosa]|uniref:MSP domain-containing protein n=1 Tax=Castilleja foliolosa TaxID=1961234 RepID=A0ABD3BPU8_9LAMI